MYAYICITIHQKETRAVQINVQTSLQLFALLKIFPGWYDGKTMQITYHLKNRGHLQNYIRERNSARPLYPLSADKIIISTGETLMSASAPIHFYFLQQQAGTGWSQAATSAWVLLRGTMKALSWEHNSYLSLYTDQIHSGRCMALEAYIKPIMRQQMDYGQDELFALAVAAGEVRFWKNK